MLCNPGEGALSERVDDSLIEISSGKLSSRRGNEVETGVVSVEVDPEVG